MSQTSAYLNGQFLPREQVSISLEDLGFLWGATVTDRVRTFAGKPFLLDEHLVRFRRSAELARIPLLATDEELRRITLELVSRNGNSHDLSVVLVATPGTGAQPTLLLYTLSISAESLQHARSQGVQLRTTSHHTSLPPSIKHRSRLNWWIAKEAIHHDDPHADPLFVDESGHLLETTTANLLAVFDGTVTSPPRHRILPGISLAYVEKLCKQLVIPFTEREISLGELPRASEVMIANSTLSLAWVARVNEHRWEGSGSLFQQLSSEWEREIGASIHGAATSLG